MVYANLFRVGYNESEFVIEFCQAHSDQHSASESTVVASVVVTPAGANELEALLRDSLDQHTRLIGRQRKSSPGEA